MNQYFNNNSNLESNIVENKVNINGFDYIFYTDNGVFNKKGLDFGTRLLLENINLNGKNSFLDMGCGCGVVGLFLLKNNPQYIIDMVDVNNRALELTKKSLNKNKLEANVFYSDTYININKKYDCIITNPPIHAGKKVVYDIIKNGKNYLNNNGEIWIVMRKDQGALSMMKDMIDYYNFEIIKKAKGFYIICGKIK
jgi:16S rRNA (guanine1207-N2)-methyltransferase